MITLISPAKSLNEETISQDNSSLPALKTDANKLSRVMKKLSPSDLKELMHISDALAQENYNRFKKFRTRLDGVQMKRAVDMFMGDVYRGLNVSDFTDDNYQFAQSHLRILSGLYGILRPLDLIQAYRLEMGTRLTTERGKNLYQFWGDKITKELNKSLRDLDSDVIINLASNEYFKVVNTKKLKARVITINFKEYRDGSLKFLSFFAKQARGKMARYIIKNQIDSIDEIKGFDVDEYRLDMDHSTEDNWIFSR